MIGGLDRRPGSQQVIGQMVRARGKQMMRYELVRMDGKWMKVSRPARIEGWPDYARERVDPFAVFNLEAKRAPKRIRTPEDPPRLSDY